MRSQALLPLLVAVSLGTTSPAAFGAEVDSLGGVTLGSKLDLSKYPRNQEGIPYAETTIAGEAGLMLIQTCGTRVHSLDFFVVYLRSYWHDRVEPPAIRTASHAGLFGLTGHRVDATQLYHTLWTALEDAGWTADRESIDGSGQSAWFVKAGLTRKLHVESKKWSRVDLVAEAATPCTSGL